MTFLHARHIPLPGDAYHARPEVSNSQLKWLPDKPEEFFGYVVDKRWTFRQTRPMELGSGLHAAIEGHKIVAAPSWALTAAGARSGNEWQRYRQSHPAWECLAEKDCICIEEMLAGARRDSFVSALLDAKGLVEHNIFAVHKGTGCDVRGRLDKLCLFEGGRIIADWKTTNVDPRDERAVNRHILDMNYHRQAAFYWDLTEALYGTPTAFQFVFFRAEIPYNALVWEMNENAIDLGRRRNDEAFADLKLRLQTGKWSHPRSSAVNLAFLPDWAYKGGEEMNLPPSSYPEFSDFANPIN